MPKTQEPVIVRARRYASQHKNEFTVHPSGELFCKLCEIIVNCERKSSVEKHRLSQKHIAFKNSSAVSTMQSFMTSPSSNDFGNRLVKAFLSSDIPLHKLTNPALKELFRSLGEEVPSISACRSMVPSIAQQQKVEIKKLIEDKAVFLVIDESEIRGSKYLNILVGTVENPSKTYAISCICLPGSCSQQTIIHAVDDCLKQYQIQRMNFLLLISDAARYMTAAGSTLKQLYPNMFHLTCLAHLLHNCAQKVRSFYQNVDDLIAAVKSATIKCKDRQQQFHHIGLPPHPIVTRWGSWLEAVDYYSEHLPAVKEVVANWEGTGSIVSKARLAVSRDTLPQELLQITRSYKQLVNLIEKFESSTCTIRDAWLVLSEVDFKEDPCSLRQYLKKRLDVNSGLQSIMSLQNSSLSPNDYNMLQSCPPSSAAVERSFSQLNNMLAPNRPFLPTNVENYFLALYNKM